eukprot:9859478-Karenia_brevis.AAC.1
MRTIYQDAKSGHKVKTVIDQGLARIAPMACAPMVAAGSCLSHATPPVLLESCNGGAPAVRPVQCVQSLNATSSGLRSDTK